MGWSVAAHGITVDSLVPPVGLQRLVRQIVEAAASDGTPIRRWRTIRNR